MSPFLGPSGAPLKVLVICPVAPPMVGGVADHLQLSLQALGRPAEAGGPGLRLALLTGPGALAEAVAPAELLPPQRAWGWGAWKGIAAQAQAWGADVVLLHHVPHLYDRRGLPWGPTLALAGGGLGGVPTVVMAHELHFAWNEGWRGWGYGAIQRLLLGPMLGGASRVVLTVQARAEALARSHPALKAKLRVLPVGPSLPPPPAWSREEARSRLGLAADAFVLADLGLAHPSKGLGAVAMAVDALRQGGVPAVAALGGELSLQHPHVQALGRLGPLEASALLACADLVVLPYADGASPRRTSLMNAWQAGACVLSTWGWQSDALALPPGSLAWAPAGDDAAFAKAALHLAQAPSERQALAQRGAEHFRQSLTWPVLAQAWATLLREAALGG